MLTTETSWKGIGCQEISFILYCLIWLVVSVSGSWVHKFNCNVMGNNKWAAESHVSLLMFGKHYLHLNHIGCCESMSMLDYLSLKNTTCYYSKMLVATLLNNSQTFSLLIYVTFNAYQQRLCPIMPYIVRSDGIYLLEREPNLELKVLFLSSIIWQKFLKSLTLIYLQNRILNFS